MAKKQLTLEEKIQNALVPEEEQPYKVPENWCWARLGSVGSIILGQYPKREDATDDDTFIPVISGVAELDDDRQCQFDIDEQHVGFVSMA